MYDDDFKNTNSTVWVFLWIRHVRACKGDVQVPTICGVCLWCQRSGDNNWTF